jgi:ketosteroid isomerase-like protein
MAEVADIIPGVLGRPVRHNDVGRSVRIDGADFFDVLAEDAVFEYVISVPGYPRRVVGRETVAGLYSGYGNSMVLHSSDELAVHHDREASVVVLEYAVHGRAVKSGRACDNRFVSVITIADHKITHWRAVPERTLDANSASQRLKSLCSLAPMKGASRRCAGGHGPTGDARRAFEHPDRDFGRRALQSVRQLPLVWAAAQLAPHCRRFPTSECALQVAMQHVLKVSDQLPTDRLHLIPKARRAEAERGEEARERLFVFDRQVPDGGGIDYESPEDWSGCCLEVVQPPFR